MSTAHKSIFVSLPVKDVAAATRFYVALGCKKNEQFSDANASTLVWSDTISFQVQSHEKFGSWMSKKVADTRETAQVFLGLSAESRGAVDAMLEAARAHGGKADVRPAIDLGWLYNRAFEDIDGNIFEAFWIDPKGAM